MTWLWACDTLGLRQDGPVQRRAGRASEAKAKLMEGLGVKMAVLLTGNGRHRMRIVRRAHRKEGGRGTKAKASLTFGSVRSSPCQRRGESVSTQYSGSKEQS